MSTFEWLAEKAGSALQSIGEAGASLLQSGLSLADATRAAGADDDDSGPKTNDDASEALARAAENALETERPQTAKAAGALNSGALDSAKSTVQAVLNIAEQFSKLDATKIFASTSPPGGLLAAGTLLINSEAESTDVTWESHDKKLRVDTVSDTSALADDFAKLFRTVDSPQCKEKVHALECSNIFSQARPGDNAERLPEAHAPGNQGEKGEKGENTKAEIVSAEAIQALFHRESTSNSGVHTTIDGAPGSIRVQTTDSTGKPITKVEKTKDGTTVIHGSETATREGEQTVLQGKDYRVVVRNGIRHVLLDDDRELVRDGNGAKIIDRRTGSEIQISQNQLRTALTTGHALVLAQEKDDLETLTEQLRSKLKPGETTIIVMTGVGTRTIFHEGTIMDVRPDHMTRIQTPDGHVFLMDGRGNMFLQTDGCNVPLDRNNLPKFIQFRNNKFYVGQFEIDPESVQVVADQITVNGASGVQTLRGRGRTATITTNNNGTADVHDSDNHIHNHGDNGKIVISNTNTPSASMVVDLSNQSVETEKILDTVDSTVIKETRTAVDSRGTVNFDGGRGPILYHDGSVRVDANTFIGADLSVRSGNFCASAEAKAASVAGDSGARAAGVYGKAMNGTVRWTDVADLNDALGNVMALISSVPPTSAAYARLMASYKELVTAISVAAPKAELAETALEKGITDSATIKQLDETPLPRISYRVHETNDYNRDNPVQFQKNGYWITISTTWKAAK